MPIKLAQPFRAPELQTRIFPNLLLLAFLVFLAFFLFKECLAILSVLPLFPKDFRCSASRRNPCLFGGFPCCFPNPSFPCFFFGKRQGKPPKKTRILYSHRTPKIPGKGEKNAQKTRNSSQEKKSRNSQKKTRKRRTGKRQGKEDQGFSWDTRIFLSL